MSILGSCNSCLTEINSEIKYITCPDCNRLYHQDCWKKNLNKCIEFGCKGTKEISDVHIEENTLTSNNTNLNNSQNLTQGSSNNNQNNFKKISRTSKDKLIIGLLFTIVILLTFIAFNFNNGAKQVSQNEINQPQISASTTVLSEPSTSYNQIVENTTNDSNSINQINDPSSFSKNDSNSYVSGNNFNLDMNLDTYYTIQVASETSFTVAENVSNIIPNSFIKAKSKTKDDKSKYFYVVLLGKFASEEDANSYRSYILNNLSIVNNYDGFPGSFITMSSRLEPVEVVAQSEINPSPIPTLNSDSLNNNYNMNMQLENYYTVQICSEKDLKRAEKISNQVANSFIKIKSKSESDKSDYYMVVVVGKFENEVDAIEYRKYLITNYSNIDGLTNISGSFITNSSRLQDISIFN